MIKITAIASSSKGNMYMTEEWKDIPGFEGIYQVSSYGRLKSFKKDTAGKILSLVNKKGGYFSIVLEAKGAKIRYARMHVLVAEAFVPNPNNLPEVNHMDFNKQNTRADNLEWTTRKNNQSHARKHNPNIIKGMVNYNQKTRPSPIIQLSLDGEYIKMHLNGKEAALASGVCQRNILQVASGAEYKPGKKRIQAGGFNWLFAHTIDFDMDMSHVHKSNREFIERQQLCAELSRRKFDIRGRNTNGQSQERAGL